MFKKTLIASAIGLLASPLSAYAVLIDFESVTTPSSCDVNSGGPIAGFTLSPYNGTTGAGFNNVTGCGFLGPTAHSGTQYMVNWNDVYGQFTRDTGTFTLNSLWVMPTSAPARPLCASRASMARVATCCTRRMWWSTRHGSR